MIEKSRLEELIEQDKVFYWVFNKEIRMMCNLATPTYWKKKWELYGKYCFETKEEAEWHKEFGCIERTERLELPTWEQFDEQKFVWFVDKKQNVCCLHYVDFSNRIFINVSGEVIDFGEITKENYTLACRKAKELFLGE